MNTITESENVYYAIQLTLLYYNKISLYYYPQ